MRELVALSNEAGELLWEMVAESDQGDATGEMKGPAAAGGPARPPPPPFLRPFARAQHLCFGFPSRFFDLCRVTLRLHML